MAQECRVLWKFCWLTLTLCLILFSVYIFLHFLSIPSTDWSNSVTNFGSTRAVARDGIGLHFVFGVTIMLLLPTQWIPSLRKRGSSLFHVWGGRIILLSTFPLCAGGFVYIFSQGAVGGSSMSTSFAIYGALILLCAAQTFIHARGLRRDQASSQFKERCADSANNQESPLTCDVSLSDSSNNQKSPHLAQHRSWAIRLSTLLVGSGIYRLMIIPMAAALNFEYYPDRDRDFAVNWLNTISWLFYPLPLLVTELYMRRESSKLEQQVRSDVNNNV